MDSLPPELLARVVSFLPCTTDLISMRLVNRVNAAIAFRPLFELLRFSGRRQDQTPPWNFGPSIERELSKGQVGRTRTIEFGKLPEVVDEILGSSLARYTKTFVFDPAYYRERFWQDYLLQLENEMYEPVDEVEFGSDDDLDGDWDDAIERVLHHRRTRPEREAETINAAQATWNEKIEEQKQNEEAVVVALTKLFQSMAGLEKIEIKPWVFNGCLFYPGLESCMYELAAKDYLVTMTFNISSVLTGLMSNAGAPSQQLFFLRYWLERFTLHKQGSSVCMYPSSSLSVFMIALLFDTYSQASKKSG